MSNLRQAAQQALEALERAIETAMMQSLKARIPECGEFAAIAQDTDWAIELLRVALAEEALQRLTDVQQDIEAALAEPNKCTHGVTDGNCKECYMAEPEQEPVFDCPRCGHCCPERKPLTDEEIGKAWSVADGEHNASAAVKRRITRAIEHAHGIKGEA